MWLSLEILAPDIRPGVRKKFGNLDLTVVESSPPKSHRGTSSIWQPIFEEIGGTLFHMGDPKAIKARHDRYYLYDAFDPDASNRVFHKLLQRYQKDFEFIVKTLLSGSKSGRIFVTTDVWLGPKPTRYRRPVTLDRFLASSRLRGLRRNSYREVVQNNGTSA